MSACNPQALETKYEMNFNGRYIDLSTGYQENSYFLNDNFKKCYEISLTYDSNIGNEKEKEEFLSLILKSQSNNNDITFKDILSGPYLSGRVPLPRAQFLANNHLLVYFENWRANFAAGYVNGTLAWTDIVELDIENKEIINWWKADENEFIITNNNYNFYIYNMGKLYMRDMNNWDTITQIQDMGLENVKSNDIRTLFFEVNDSKFSIYKSHGEQLSDSRDTIKDKCLLVTIDV